MNTIEWNGEGLPPVGTVCEVQTWVNREWKQTTILAHHLGFAVHSWSTEGDDMEVDSAPPQDFRPIRTPEQIAAEERIAGLNEMIRHMKDHPLGTHGASHLQELMIHEDVARDLWEAGYRKQEEQ